MRNPTLILLVSLLAAGCAEPTGPDTSSHPVESFAPLVVHDPGHLIRLDLALLQPQASKRGTHRIVCLLRCDSRQILLGGAQVGMTQGSLHVDDRCTQPRRGGRVEVP